MDPLEATFLFCFVFGLAMSGLSFLLGTLQLPGFGHHEIGHGGGGHAGGHGHGDLPAHHGGHAGGEAGQQATHGGPSPFNVSTATAFLAFFGGVGYLLYGTLGLAAAQSLLVAVAAGLAGGALVFWFLVRVLLKGQRFLDPSEFRLEGSVATVARAIRPDGIGEIVFIKDGTRRSEGARSADGTGIAAGTEVVIVRYEHGLAWVEPWASYVGES